MSPTPNNEPWQTVRDIDRLIDWYQLRIRADRHLSIVTLREYLNEIHRLEAQRKELRKRL